MTSVPDALAIAEETFRVIGERFPNLTMMRQPDDPVEISIVLPVQTGLRHRVWLALQNGDELHFSVGSFWLGWFPCTNPAKVDRYLDAVCGFLSGRYRVLEHLRDGRCIKAQLQAPDSTRGWRTLGTWGKFWLPSFTFVRVNVISNAQIELPNSTSA